jgi:hypothetical protein
MTIEMAWSPATLQQNSNPAPRVLLTNVVGHPTETRGEEKLPLVSTHTEFVHGLVEDGDFGHEGRVDSFGFGKSHVLGGVIENSGGFGISVDGQIVRQVLFARVDGRHSAVRAFFVFAKHVDDVV